MICKKGRQLGRQSKELEKQSSQYKKVCVRYEGNFNALFIITMKIYLFQTKRGALGYILSLNLINVLKLI